MYCIALTAEVKNRFKRLAALHHRPAFMEAELALQTWLHRFENNESPRAAEGEQNQ